MWSETTPIHICVSMGATSQKLSREEAADGQGEEGRGTRALTSRSLPMADQSLISLDQDLIIFDQSLINSDQTLHQKDHL